MPTASGAAQLLSDDLAGAGVVEAEGDQSEGLVHESTVWLGWLGPGAGKVFSRQAIASAAGSRDRVTALGGSIDSRASCAYIRFY